MDFYDLFQSYWWLLFPLAFFIAGGWDSYMKFQRHKANLELLKTYAASGNEPPEHLVKALEKTTKGEFDLSGDDGYDGSGKSGGGGSAFLVLLFAGLAGIFAYAGYSGMMDLGEEAYFIAMIMGVLCVAFLGAAIFKRHD